MKKGLIYQTIYAYGTPVLQSELFALAGQQTHHKCTTVALHSMRVAVVSIVLARLFSGIDMNCLVTAALAHDFGILDRWQVFSGKHDCWYRHPIRTREILEREYPDTDEKIMQAVESHMWPLAYTMPHSKEAAILCIADKLAACYDMIYGFGRLHGLCREMSHSVSKYD